MLNECRKEKLSDDANRSDQEVSRHDVPEIYSRSDDFRLEWRAFTSEQPDILGSISTILENVNRN